MKKFLLRSFIAVLVLLVLAVIAVGLFLDKAVKRGVETVGSKQTGVAVTLENASLSIFSGAGTIKGLVVGNPEGFKSPHAISIESQHVALKPGSLFSDKIIINKIEITAPEIILEAGLQGNNLGKILKNLETASGSGTETPAPSEGSGKKLQVDEFLLTGAKLRIDLPELGQSYGRTISDIHLTGLGTGPEGITSAELSKRVLNVIYKEAVAVLNERFPDLGRQAEELISKQSNDLLKKSGLSTNTIDAINKGVSDLLKKK